MRALTPIERAVAMYCPDWGRGRADQAGLAKVNPETLGDETPPAFAFRYIDIGSVTRGAIDWAAVRELRFADAPSRARRVVRHGDTMISTVRPLLGAHAYAAWPDDQPTVCSTGFAVVRCAHGFVPEFFSHLPFAEQVTRQLVAWQCGTNYPAVNERDIRQLVIPTPPPDEQATIARLLDAVDTAMGRTRAAAERAREVKRALVQRVLSDGLRGETKRKTPLGRLPRSWDVVPVSAVVISFQYGLSVPMETKGHIPILRMGNIQDGDVLLRDLKFVSLSPRVVTPYLLRSGDVLFNRTNSQEWVGKVGIYRSDIASVFASYLIRLLPDPEKIDNYYLGHVLGSYPSQCRIKRYATPGVQQVNINATNLGKVLIPLPVGDEGLREQRELGAMLEAAGAAVRSYEPVLAAYQSLKKSLMHDLLTGRVRVRDVAKVAAS